MAWIVLLKKHADKVNAAVGESMFVSGSYMSG